MGAIHIGLKALSAFFVSLAFEAILAVQPPPVLDPGDEERESKML